MLSFLLTGYIMLMFGDNCLKQLLSKTMSYLRTEPCKVGWCLGIGTPKSEMGVAKRKIWKVEETNMALPMIHLFGLSDIGRQSLTLYCPVA